MIRPTSRLLTLLAVGPPAATGLVLLNERLWILAVGLVAALIVLALVDASIGLRPSQLDLHVEPPATLPVGLYAAQLDAEEEEDGLAADPTLRPEEQPVLRLDFEGPPGARPVIEALLDVNDLLEPPPSFQFRPGPDGRIVIETPLTPLRRGEARVERLWLRWKGPFGLAWSGKIEPLDLTIPAIPDIRGVRRAALALDRRSALFGLKPQTMGGDGAEFDALRDYHPGMDRRAVDWKRTAKHRKLLVKEYQAERNHNVIMAIDSGHLMREPLEGAPKLDHAVNSALTLAYQALAEGDRVGVFGFDAQVRLFHPPRPGKSAFPAIQKALSTLDYAIEETNFTLGLTRLAQKLDRRSIVILITDFLDTVTAELMVETLAHLARRHLILFAALKDAGLERTAFGAPADATELARAVAAAEILKERRLVLGRLRRLGVDAVDVRPAELDTALLNRFLRAKRRSEPAPA